MSAGRKYKDRKRRSTAGKGYTANEATTTTTTRIRLTDDLFEGLGLPLLVDGLVDVHHGTLEAPALRFGFG